MACGTCGQRRTQMTQEQASAAVSGVHPKPVYVVTTPEGKSEEFSDYGLAAIFREKSNGTMTTTTAK